MIDLIAMTQVDITPSRWHEAGKDEGMREGYAGMHSHFSSDQGLAD